MTQYKFKSFMLIGLVSAVLLACTGCNDFYSAQGVVGTAYKALRTNDPKLFNRTLTGAALEQYGNLDGMGSLQKKLSGLEVSYGDTLLVSAEQDARGWDTVRNYALPILGRPSAMPTSAYAKILAAGVICRIEYVYHPRSLVGNECWDPAYRSLCYPLGPGGLAPGPEYGYTFRDYDELSNCQIAELN